MRKIILCTTLALLLIAQPACADDLILSPPVGGEMVRGFHLGPTPYSPGHRGVDLASPPGTPVLASAQGRIYFAGKVAGRWSVSIDHGNGLRTTYTPVKPSVSVGEPVASGDKIGVLLPGHCPTGCLHWGLTDGQQYYDPIRYLVNAQIRLVPLGTLPKPRVQLPAAQLTDQSHGGSAPVSGRVSSPFGMRKHPITGVYKLHDGTDFAAPCGTPITSPWDGVVEKTDLSAGYGYRLHIRHHDSLSTAYAHLPGFEVSPGQRIRAGQRIAAVGSTGYSTGCHLHWMAWISGKLSDPMTLLVRP